MHIAQSRPPCKSIVGLADIADITRVMMSDAPVR